LTKRRFHTPATCSRLDSAIDSRQRIAAKREP
jgi:hypothetical protein